LRHDHRADPGSRRPRPTALGRLRAHGVRRRLRRGGRPRRPPRLELLERDRGLGRRRLAGPDRGAFTGVELAGSNVVAVKVGGKQRVVVHADRNLLRQVTTAVNGQTLVIDDSGSFRTRSPIHVDVTVPALDAVTLSGSGTVAATGVSRRLDVSLAGSGDLQLGALTACEVTATVAGSGRIVVRATRSLRASVAGSGAIVYLGKPSVVSTHVTGSGAVIPG
jgi:hypothetical protein